MVKRENPWGLYLTGKGGRGVLGGHGTATISRKKVGVFWGSKGMGSIDISYLAG